MNTNKQTKSRGFTLVEALVAVAIVLVCLAVVGILSCKSMGGLNIEYSEGSRKGTIYKLSEKGLIWDTHEGELSLGLVTQNAEGQLVNEIFHFSVSNTEVANKLEKAMLQEQKVKLTYKQYFLRGYKYGSTQYDITEVEILAPNNTK